jgi:lipopolysaccharide/colanic/teichoic acid biosynthesis glycosyltransferase
MKRLLDIIAAALGLVSLSWLLMPVMFMVWLQDRHSPFYIAPRVGKDGREFRMVKLRSMVIGADRQGATSTSDTDRRITRVGQFIRRYKLDELMQLWNVLRGEMSLVGPRPQVRSGVALYTQRELELLRVRPGITDFASIVFSDEGVILKDSPDADRDYDRLIRPWKSRLGLIYIANSSLWLDLRLIALTLVAVVSRAKALRAIGRLLVECNAPADVVAVAKRESPMFPSEPPDERWSLARSG